MRPTTLDFYGYDRCQTILDDAKFHLVERGGALPIEISKSGAEKNSTPVFNESRKTLLVLPLDKNVPLKKKDSPHDDESLCDVLIQTHQNNDVIIFAELKNRRTSPVKEAAKQLAITLAAYEEHHTGKLASFDARWAYITHRYHHHAKQAYFNLSSTFRKEYGVKLHIRKDIIVPRAYRWDATAKRNRRDP